MMNTLESESYFLCENFLTPAQIQILRDDFSAREFRAAGIGREARKSEIRRDEIAWLEAGDPDFLWQAIADLQNELNHKFYLGLERFEGHYARYPAGGFYLRHRDNLSHKDSRVVSLILYLNENWQPEDGGELELELPTGLKRIAPRAGTLVCFLSRDIEHQVLLSHKIRLSFCGWFHCTTKAGLSPF